MPICLLRASGLFGIFSFCTTEGTQGVVEGWREEWEKDGLVYPKRIAKSKVANDTTGRTGCEKERREDREANEYHAVEYHANEYHANEYDTDLTKKRERERGSRG